MATPAKHEPPKHEPPQQESPKYVPPEGPPNRAPGVPPGLNQGADRGSDSGEDETPPDPGMETVVHEQRRRAAEMEKVGVQNWVNEHAGPRDDKPKQVAGVSPTEKR